MRNYLIFLVLLLVTSLFSQKHDYVWLFGYDSNEQETSFGGSVLDFKIDTVEKYYEYRDMNFYQANTSMCDTAGNLLFYTNGIYVANTLGLTMENGEGLNPGQMATDQQDNGYILDQGVLSIPIPKSDSLFYLFHADKMYWGEIPSHSKKLYYSIIDMSKSNGLGEVTKKNQIIIEDYLAPGKITTIRHANGIDWWILMRKLNSSEYYRILVSSAEVFEIDEIEIGNDIPNPGVGQAVFSPNGHKYVRYQTVSMQEGFFLDVYDFDRCTGELSNPIQINEIDSAWSGGVAISPNSRFLYVSSYNYVYQYDFWADDFEASKDTVAIYDGFSVLNFFRTRFSLMQLGPNGKIYITSSHGVPYLHVINNPDLLGDSCDVCQHCIELPTFNAFSMPNFPNYRLGAADELCEPDGVNTPAKLEIKVSVYPNPTSGVVWVEMEKGWQGAVFVLYDALGRTIKHIKLSKEKTEVSLGGVGEGLYFYKVENGGDVLDNGKIVVLE